MIMVKDWFDEYDQKMYDLNKLYIKEYSAADPEDLPKVNQWYADQKEMIRMTMTAKAKLMFGKEGD